MTAGNDLEIGWLYLSGLYQIWIHLQRPPKYSDASATLKFSIALNNNMSHQAAYNLKEHNPIHEKMMSVNFDIKVFQTMRTGSNIYTSEPSSSV